MARNVIFASKSYKSISNQKGIALLLLVFALILVVLAYSVKALNSSELQVRKNEKTISVLADAKSALMAWAITNSNRPGLMPYPDRSSSDGNYDGNSDCYTTTTLDANYDKLLGKLPWRAADDADCTNLVSGIGQEFKDSSGEHLWYAVSRNLVYDYFNGQYPIINPGMINSPYNAPPYQRQGGTTAYPWLKVYDKNGQLISDRVAAVIIAPEAPLNDQDRSGGIAGATKYLDRFDLQSGGVTKSNRTYSSADEDFYMGEDSRNVRSDNTIYQQPYYFNDKLVYITIDELMAEIEKRVTGEARKVLQKYYANQGSYPHAAKLGATTNYSCDGSSLKGFLPTESKNTSCSCTWGAARACTCSFANVSSITFKRNAGAYGTTGARAPTGACTVPTSNTCSCTGAGTCKQNNAAAPTRFSCNAVGACTSTVAGAYTFSGTFNTRSGACTIPSVPPSGCSSSIAVTCSGVGTFAFNACSDLSLSRAIVSTTTTNSKILTTTSDFNAQNISAGMFISGTGVSSGTLVSSVTSSTTLTMSNNATVSGINNLTFSMLPDWFAANKWQDYIYYDATSALTVGAKTGVQALLISSGSSIITSPFAASKVSGPQSRPSCSLAEYLDSVENTNNDGIFDAVNTTRKSTYNDQMFIVAP
jgi:hypothetical protein